MGPGTDPTVDPTSRRIDAEKTSQTGLNAKSTLSVTPHVTHMFRTWLAPAQKNEV